MLNVRITGYVDKLVTFSGDRSQAVIPIDVYDNAEGHRRTLFAPSGKYDAEGNYIPYSDIDLIKEIEKELTRAGLIVVVSPAAPVFTSLTPVQSTIAMKNFNVKEKEL